MSCDLSELLEQTRPPDPELVDLIEQAFLEGQISSQAHSTTLAPLHSIKTSPAGAGSYISVCPLGRAPTVGPAAGRGLYAKPMPFARSLGASFVAEFPTRTLGARRLDCAYCSTSHCRHWSGLVHPRRRSSTRCSKLVNCALSRAMLRQSTS